MSVPELSAATARSGSGCRWNWSQGRTIPNFHQGIYKTLLADQAVTGQRGCSWGHLFGEEGNAKDIIALWALGENCSHLFRKWASKWLLSSYSNLCHVLCGLSAEHWLPQACGNPRLMRCDPRNTGQVCLAVIANDRIGQKELAIILKFFFSPSCLWDCSPYPQRVWSLKWDLCLPKLPF